MKELLEKIISNLEELTKVSSEKGNVCLAAAGIHAQGILARNPGDLKYPQKASKKKSKTCWKIARP